MFTFYHFQNCRIRNIKRILIFIVKLINLFILVHVRNVDLSARPVRIDIFTDTRKVVSL